jgi:3-phenylpropionate/cinnamic acid dioxygenase small subunit
MAGTPVSLELRLEIADFLAREAELLDDRQLTAWLALFADDARYAVRLREPPRPTSARGDGPTPPAPLPVREGGGPKAASTGSPLPSEGRGAGGVRSSGPDAPPAVEAEPSTDTPQDWGAGAATLLFEDDKPFLALRVQRLEGRLAHAERPPSTTRHLITNVIVEPAEGDEVEVRTSFVVYQVRPGLADQLFFGKRQDRLRKVAGEWRIARRLVTLDQNPLPRTLTIFF